MNRGQIQAQLELTEKCDPTTPVTMGVYACLLTSLLADEEKRAQVNVAMSAEDMAVMDSLIERTGCHNRSEIVRMALRHYSDHLEKSFQEGQKVFREPGDELGAIEKEMLDTIRKAGGATALYKEVWTVAEKLEDKGYIRLESRTDGAWRRAELV